MKADSKTHFLVTWNSHIKTLVFLMDGDNIDELKGILDRLREIALTSAVKLDLPLSDPVTKGWMEKGSYHRDDMVNLDRLTAHELRGAPL
jgi:hypothetical protein